MEFLRTYHCRSRLCDLRHPWFEQKGDMRE